MLTSEVASGMPQIPTLIALANLGLNAALDAAFYRFGTWGIPLSTSVVNVAGTVALLALLRSRLGRVELPETLRAAARVLVASAVLAAVAFPLWFGLDRGLGRSFASQVVSLGGALLAGGCAYLISCRLLGVRELEALLSLRRRPRRG